MSSIRGLAPFFLLLAVAACDKSPTPAGTGAATPSDPKLAKLYAQTCKACHGTGAGGAPLAGDKAAWAPRVAQGDKTLLDHAINGYKGMPPMGSCSDCGEAEFTALIHFMSGGS